MGKGMKPRIAISFSGGRTSAVMTKILHEKWAGKAEISTVFANTGCEHEATLDFVRDCDEAFGWGVVWLEADVGPAGVGIRHKIVNYETASRNGEPFESYIQKHGIPCKTHPQCTSRLKEEVMDSYRHRDLGWDRGSYDTAIGIRSDEADRMSSKRKERRFVYPLVDLGYNKSMVNRTCASWAFDLKIPGDHYGNCTWCWKKSYRKLMTLAVEAPEVFDFPRRMEKLYARVKQEDGQEDRVFFRGSRSVEDIFEMAKQPFTPYKDAELSPALFDGFLDVGQGCGESCEIGADE